MINVKRVEEMKTRLNVASGKKPQLTRMPTSQTVKRPRIVGEVMNTETETGRRLDGVCTLIPMYPDPGQQVPAGIAVVVTRDTMTMTTTSKNGIDPSMKWTETSVRLDACLKTGYATEKKDSPVVYDELSRTVTGIAITGDLLKKNTTLAGIIGKAVSPMNTWLSPKSTWNGFQGIGPVTIGEANEVLRLCALQEENPMVKQVAGQSVPTMSFNNIDETKDMTSVAETQVLALVIFLRPSFYVGRPLHQLREGGTALMTYAYQVSMESLFESPNPKH